MGKRKVFFFVVAMHIILVLGDLVVFEYEQVSDSIRYIFVANEFDSRDFFDLNPEANW